MLEKEIRINTVVLPNRVVMPPMASAKGNADGTVTPQLIRYYTERAEAGTGLIITEHAYIHPLGKAGPNQVSVSRDSDIDGLKQLTEAVHACGKTKIFAQINHAGSAAKPDDASQQTVSASAVQSPRRLSRPLPKELSEEEIHSIVQQFAAAAIRVKKAGFDGVEIHAAHSYLLNQFYSPLTNRRTDLYGGTVENRIRMTLEVLKAVREAVGTDFAVCVRLGGVDDLEGGSTVSDSVQACVMLAENGADLLSLTGGMSGYIRPGVMDEGYYRDLSVPVRRAVNVPVLLAGGIVTKEGAERLLAEGAADLIGVGRAMLEDARWAEKALG